MSEQNELFELDENDAALLDQVIDPEVRHKWPESLAAMLDVVAAAFRADGLPADRAARLAGKAMHALAIYHGGRMFYLPRNSEVEYAIRDRQLFHLWMTGQATAPELASRYRMSYQRAMQIIAEQRGLWQRKHAPPLPGFDPPG